MARNRTVNYAVVDIKLLREGTTVETYVELFEELRSNPRQIPLERNNYLKFRFIKPLNEDNLLNGFSGEVFKSNGNFNVMDNQNSKNKCRLYHNRTLKLLLKLIFLKSGFSLY